MFWIGIPVSKTPSLSILPIKDEITARGSLAILMNLASGKHF